ncbi:NfeD family protein [Ruminococcus sp.]|uniref:NfeD family protein n=1 Tax=Ruminococcus sp. TaxID=41978 RepID=UPI00266DCA97|nr:NfeD family protein [uncultured Ruminococcus sp.]
MELNESQIFPFGCGFQQETWTVKSDKAPLFKKTKVKVLVIEGVKIIVEPVTE